MPTCENKHGGISVDLNEREPGVVWGEVWDAAGNVVAGAEVTMENETKETLGEATTNQGGDYSINLKAESGDVIFVFVKWKDEKGGLHVIHCTVTV